MSENKHGRVEWGNALMVKRPFPGSRRWLMVSFPDPVMSWYQTAFFETIWKQS